ncbi:MAG: hypothetical protein RMN25_06695 [Anaerolineae bacterium]|nr:hypothetical protein [Thermoflexales bacterium]MDW8407458.1 hypothetical protein [Anaerolineae bacterium]
MRLIIQPSTTLTQRSAPSVVIHQERLNRYADFQDAHMDKIVYGPLPAY